MLGGWERAIEGNFEAKLRVVWERCLFQSKREFKLGMVSCPVSIFECTLHVYTKIFRFRFDFGSDLL